MLLLIERVVQRQVSEDLVGVVVLSATQLQITLSEPDSSFLWVLATPVGRPLPQSHCGDLG